MITTFTSVFIWSPDVNLLWIQLTDQNFQAIFCILQNKNPISQYGKRGLVVQISFVNI